jgi:hypothetical protein
MVEVADTLTLFGPSQTVFSPTLESAGYLPPRRVPGSERDNGHVVVTSQRIFFDGIKANREWSYAQLTGLAHGRSTPITLMRVANRQRLSGLVLDGAAAVAFQFFLSLGLAVHRNDRADFVAHLRRLESHHNTLRPPVPAPVSPQEAPSTVRAGLHRGRLILFGAPGASVRQVVPSFALALVLVCVWGAFTAPPTAKRPTANTGAAVTETTTPYPPAVVAAPSPTSAPPVVTLPSPSTTTAAPPKPPPPPPPPPAYDLCGAPQTLNYGCSGGSTINNPPSNFCAYFNCIDSFWKNTSGYVMVQDHMFSHSVVSRAPVPVSRRQQPGARQH